MRSPPGRVVVVHDRVAVGLDEHEQQAVQQPGRGVVQLRRRRRRSRRCDGRRAAARRGTAAWPRRTSRRRPRAGSPAGAPAPPAPPRGRRPRPRRRCARVRSRRGSAPALRRAAGPCRGTRRARPRARWPGARGRRRGSRRTAAGTRAFRRSVESPTPPSAPMAPVRRVATSRSRARRSNRRCPPSVVNAGTRPSSAQRRSVSGSTPRRRLAWPSGSRSAGGRSGRDRASGTSPPCPGRHRARSGGRKSG